MQWHHSINRRVVWGAFKVTALSVLIAVLCAVSAVYYQPEGERFMRITLILTTLISFVTSAPISFVITSQSVRLAELNAQLQHEANYDWLTKVMNRRAFFSAIEQYRQHQGNVAVLLIDADHFKLINERHGYHSGDEALKLLSRTLEQAITPNAVLGRIGGEEFGIILPDCSISQAVEIACRINTAVSGLNFITPENRPCPLSVSIGVDRLHQGNAEYPLRGADNALFVAKSSGRNGVVAYDDATMRHSRDKAA